MPFGMGLRGGSEYRILPLLSTSRARGRFLYFAHFKHHTKPLSVILPGCTGFIADGALARLGLDLYGLSYLSVGVTA